MQLLDETSATCAYDEQPENLIMAVLLLPSKMCALSLQETVLLGCRQIHASEKCRCRLVYSPLHWSPKIMEMTE